MCVCVCVCFCIIFFKLVVRTAHPLCPLDPSTPPPVSRTLLFSLLLSLFPSHWELSRVVKTAHVYRIDAGLVGSSALSARGCLTKGTRCLSFHLFCWQTTAMQVSTCCLKFLMEAGSWIEVWVQRQGFCCTPCVVQHMWQHVAYVFATARIYLLCLITIHVPDVVSLQFLCPMYFADAMT